MPSKRLDHIEFYYQRKKFRKKSRYQMGLELEVIGIRINWDNSKGIMKMIACYPYQIVSGNVSS